MEAGITDHIWTFAGVAKLMLAGFHVGFTPFKVALLACAIYLCFIGTAPLAVMLMSRFLGTWGVSATRGGWTVLNTLLFMLAFALSWQIIGPLRLPR
jgi:hypothetical protein